MRSARLVVGLPLVVLGSLASLAACGASHPEGPASASASLPSSASAAPAAPAPVAHAPVPAVPSGVDTASLDPSVAPCDDFFHYACGGWIKSHPIPADESEASTFQVLQEQNELTLRAILEKDAAKPSDEPYAKAVGDLYASCMDEAAIEKDGVRALAADMKRIAGVHDLASLAATMGRLGLGDISPYFDLGRQSDYADATREIGELSQAGLGMPDRDYYLKEDAESVALRGKYVAHVERVFALFGDSPEAAKKEAREVMALETELAKKQMSLTDQRDPAKVFHRMDRAALTKLAPSFPWAAYFHGLSIPDVAVVNIDQPDYVAFVDARLKGTSKEAWASEVQPYLRWQLASQYLNVLPDRFVDEWFSFYKDLTGAAEIRPRWRRCVEEVDQEMGFALAIPFVKQTLGEDGKKAAVDGVKAIEAAMEADLGTLAWMDAPTRARALEKLHSVANMIGYPDPWRKYDGLVIDRRSNAGNVQRATEFDRKRRYASVGKAVDRSEWHMTPPQVDAYYSASTNQMVFPAGILEPPFYSTKAPDAVNFGAIGMVMGHELTHGFDDEGRKFDAVGNVKDWWTPSVGAEFDKRAACVSDQYGGYVATADVHLNGALTLGENLADLGGLKLALAALRARAPASTEDERRLFFGFAAPWCAAVRPEEARLRVAVDPHSPPQWRVNGVLANTPEFARAFECQAGDALVRPAEKTCSVW